MLRLFLLLIYGIPILVSSLFSGSSAKSSLEKLQLLFGTLLFSIFIIYMSILFMAVSDAITTQIEPSNKPLSITISQTIILLITLLESLLPNIRQISEKIIIK